MIHIATNYFIGLRQFNKTASQENKKLLRKNNKPATPKNINLLFYAIFMQKYICKCGRYNQYTVEI